MTFLQRVLRARLLIILLLPLSSFCVMGIVVDSQQRGGRIAPPSALTCDRSDVTLYDGKVLTYRRRKGSTFLRVRTSFDTTEVVTLHHRGTDDPSSFFLLNGEPFERSDWRKIERRKGVLRPGVRANVWVCRGNPAIQPLVDWQYRRQEQEARMQIIKNPNRERMKTE